MKCYCCGAGAGRHGEIVSWVERSSERVRSTLEEPRIEDTQFVVACAVGPQTGYITRSSDTPHIANCGYVSG